MKTEERINSLTHRWLADWAKQKIPIMRLAGYETIDDLCYRADVRAGIDRLLDIEQFEGVLTLDALLRRWRGGYGGYGLYVQCALHGMPRTELRVLHARYLAPGVADVVRARKLCNLTESTFIHSLTLARFWILARMQSFAAAGEETGALALTASDSA